MENGSLLVNDIKMQDVVLEDMKDIETLSDWEQDVYCAIEDAGENEDMYYFGVEFAERYQNYYRQLLQVARDQSRADTLARGVKVEGKEYKALAIDVFDRHAIDITWSEGQAFFWLVEKDQAETVIISNDAYQEAEATQAQLSDMKKYYEEKIDLINRGLKKFENQVNFSEKSKS